MMGHARSWYVIRTLVDMVYSYKSFNTLAEMHTENVSEGGGGRGEMRFSKSLGGN